MKYQSLRNKKPGDKDLELRNTYRKRRLFEVQEQEAEEDLNEDFPLPDPDNNTGEQSF
jgi:hypothetical protein